MTTPNTIIADMQRVETNLRQQIAHLNDEVAGLKSDVSFVEKQRDELINAIETLLDMDVCYKRGLPIERAVDACRRAISSIKGSE